MNKRRSNKHKTNREKRRTNKNYTNTLIKSNIRNKKMWNCRWYFWNHLTISGILCFFFLWICAWAFCSYYFARLLCFRFSAKKKNWENCNCFFLSFLCYHISMINICFFSSPFFSQIFFFWYLFVHLLKKSIKNSTRVIQKCWWVFQNRAFNFAA